MKYVSQGVLIAFITSFFFSIIGVSAETELTLNNGINNIAHVNSELYSKGEQQANAYILLKLDDDAWAGKHPKLDNYGVIYYLDTNPAYIEYPIICEKSDCGYVTIALIGYAPTFVEGSASGTAPSQVLEVSYKGKFGTKTNNARFYRGGVFDKYLIGDVDDGVSFDARYENLKGTEKKKRVLNTLVENSTGSTIYVGSTITINDTTGTNVYVNGSSAADCPSRIPCYYQQNTTYNGLTCASGCGPVALGMLMGYYDRNGKSNLLPFLVAPSFQSSTSQTMITDIGKLIGTVCNGTSGESNTNMVLNGVQYALSKGYSLSTSAKYIRSNYTDLTFKGILQTEINASRPVIGQSQSHFFVIYGYSNNTPSLIVRVNFGWANAGTASSNVDVSMNDLFRYNGGTQTLLYMLTYNIR